jgi:hypothetical protein
MKLFFLNVKPPINFLWVRPRRLHPPLHNSGAELPNHSPRQIVHKNKKHLLQTEYLKIKLLLTMSLYGIILFSEGDMQNRIASEKAGSKTAITPY